MLAFDRPLLLWPGPALAEQGYVGRQLRPDRGRLIESVDLSGGMPAGWTPDAQLGGTWKVRDGALWGAADPKGPAVIWRRGALPSNFAVVFRGAAMPTHDKPINSAERIGEINVFWNGSGDAMADDFQATVGSMGGWYGGFCGIEYLRGSGGMRSECTAVSREFDQAAQRPYTVVAGRFDDTDFYFVNGTAAAQVTPGFDTSKGKLLALATFGDAEESSLVRFWDIHVVELTADSMQPIAAGELTRGGRWRQWLRQAGSASDAGDERA